MIRCNDGARLALTNEATLGAQVASMFFEDYGATVAYTNRKEPAADGLVWILIDRVRASFAASRNPPITKKQA